MDKVVVTKSKRDSLAQHINEKAGTTGAKTIAQMQATVDGITAGGGATNLQSKSVTYTSNGTNTITPDAGYDGLSSVDVTVNVASGGGAGETPASANWNDVTFIDYDGSVLYSYSLAEAQALTVLPELPAHDGLVCQGWNWTLEAIKALNSPVTVGAMYITDDGATRLHIRIATVGRMTVPLYISQTVSNCVTIDWGDGSVTETLAGTGNVNTTHTYAKPGDYTISLMPEVGCTLSLGAGSSSYCVMGPSGNNGRVYCNMLQDVSIGKNVTSIGNYAFQYCNSLASVTIPDGITSIGLSAFQFCYGMRYYDFSACTIVPNLVDKGAFDKIPSDCQMLIPAALYDEWRAATNWAVYAKYMVAV